MNLKKTINDIASLKVQGAQNVARESILALREAALKSKAKTAIYFLHEINHTKDQLFRTRPTEPLTRNCLNYMTADIKFTNADEIKKTIEQKTLEVLQHLLRSEETITTIGSNKIKDGMVVFTHCHSSTVMNILKNAKKQGAKFEVYNTETRPNLQGRITAKELAKEGIKVTHFIDSAARLALKNADLFLFGADAITSEAKIVNKVGTELFAEVALKHEVNSYCCTDSWKFDPATTFGFEEIIEKRFADEVWKNPPKGVKISNYVFEIIDPNLVTGIISELGVYKPETFVEEVRRKYKWMF
jgi:ribose 1,5-bisphosphate isomerase